MIDRSVRARPDIHPQHCDCVECDAAEREPTLNDATQAIAGRILLGLFAGHILVTLYDWATSGPGALSVFGL